MSEPQDPRPSATSLRDGDKVGAYVLERRVGGGTFADVWLGRHAVLRSRHAIKLLDPQWVAHPMMRERFLSEGRILAQLRHPALVAVTDVLDVPPDRIGLVMEFVEGGTLADRIARGALPLPLALALATDVLDGMQHAHEAGVIHRDLKPENILIVDRTDRAHAIVVDFGIAKVVAGAEVDASLSVGTRAQTRMGTPRYMSPEQIESSHAVDPRSDVFSIGAILYEMLLGRVAFPGETATDVMYHVTRGNMNPAPELSAPLRAVVERALAVSPAARFESAAALRDALAAVEKDAVLAPPPVVAASTAVPTTRPGTEPTFTSRQDPTMATPGTALPASAPPDPPRSRPTSLAWILIPLGLAGLVGAAGLALGLSFLRSEIGADGGTPLSRDEIVPIAPTPTPVAPVVAPPQTTTATTPAPADPAAAPSSHEPAPTPDRLPAPGTPSAATTHGAALTPAHAPNAPTARAKPGPTDAQRIDGAWAKSRGAATTCTRGAKTVWKLSVGFAASGEPTKVAANASPRDATVATCLEGVGRKLRAGKLDDAGTRVFTLAP